LGGHVLATLLDLGLVVERERPLGVLPLRLAADHDIVRSRRLHGAHGRVVRGLLHGGLILHLLVVRLRGRRRRLGAHKPGTGEYERDSNDRCQHSLHCDLLVCATRWNPAGLHAPSVAPPLSHSRYFRPPGTHAVATGPCVDPSPWSMVKMTNLSNLWRLKAVSSRRLSASRS